MKEHHELVPVRTLRAADDHSSAKSIAVKNDNFCDPLQSVATLTQTLCYHADSVMMFGRIRQKNPLATQGQGGIT